MRYCKPIRLTWWLPRALVAHKGFTFQSPYLYHLIRHILFAKEGIYAMEWAKNEILSDDSLSRRQQKLELKKLYLIAHLSILIRPTRIVIIGPADGWAARILRVMHPKSHIICIDTASELHQATLPFTSWDMMIVINGIDVAQYIDSSNVSIIDQPYGSRSKSETWCSTAYSAPTALDLYDLGIIIHREGLHNGYRRVWF